MREERILKHGSILLLLGISLVCLAVFAPNHSSQPGTTNFFKIAISSSWGKMMDYPAAWCSFKIILLCLGLFLVIESVGTILSVLKLRVIALPVYCLHLVPSLGVLFGSYCLLKALF